ncbi:von Willebrand factor A domain-containing protein 7-like [Candoia aspera]|uniref:von Willebrand factor A domain-containing protein 7-like n=1 Tax=Candoia aspera TaxID=51853 RepID=UPI002FD7A19A
MLLPRQLPLLLYVGLVSGFYPNHESGGIASSDFTDADITEKGVLQAVAWFMEKNPLPGRRLMNPGELKDKNPVELFKAHFEADVSPRRFQEALKTIIDGNNQIEAAHIEDSSYFFHCEEINKSIRQFRILRDTMFANLKEPVSSAALDLARLSAGKALHILQKFYSNTNWIEMRNTDPYEYLLNEDADMEPVTPSSKPTCRDCTKEPSGQYSCMDNILVNNMLTSGYKLSATCKEKIQGKCGHGGKNDVTQDIYPAGGINKETSDPLLSPHFYLHKEAAQVAIEATKNFFVRDDASLLSQTNQKIFEKFFNLEGYSLTFVIDTTSSMAEDIAQVKVDCLKILRNYSTSPDAPHNYILVPFNDPDVGPVHKTQKVDVFESYISSLSVNGGGDCPEMSLSGLKLALEESLPRSQIYSFTDAGAKDEFLKDDIKRLCETTGSTTHFILTDYCAPTTRRGLAKRNAGASRRHYDNIYEELASFSDGYYVQTTRNRLSEVLGIVEMSMNAALVKIAHDYVDGSEFSFPVDESLSEISISIKSRNLLAWSIFSFNIFQPSGDPLPKPHMIIDTNNHKVVKVSPVPQQGRWTLSMTPSGSYEVEIRGKSLLDFTYQLMQKQDDYMLPIQGRPVEGSNYTISMKILGPDKGAQVQSLVISDGLGGPIHSILLNQTSDALGNILVFAPVHLDTPSPMLKVQGLSPSDLPFSRLNIDPIHVESVQILPLANQNSTLLPGGSLEVSVQVVNYGSAATFTFEVWDVLGFTQSFRPKKRFLAKGGSTNLIATFVAPVKSTSFASSLVIFTAKSSSSQNYRTLPITVIPKTALETEKNPPVYQPLKFSMPCGADSQHRPNCFQLVWRLRFSAEDAEAAVTVQINPNPGGLSCQPAEADNKKKLICDYKSNCCSPLAELLITDGNGNMKNITVDHNMQPSTPAFF